MANFPTSIDTLTNPTGTDKVSVVDHAAQHSEINDIAEALQAKVGADSSAVTTSHDYKLGNVTGSDKAVSLTGTETLTNKTLTSPTITNKSSTGADSGAETLTNKTIDPAAGSGNVIDGDKLEIDFSASNYTPTDTAETDDTGQLTAHLKGIDTAFGAIGSGTLVTDFTAARAITAGDPVGAVLGVDDLVSQASFGISGATGGLSYSSKTVTWADTLTNTNTVHVDSIDTDKFVFLYEVNNTELYAVVATWSTSTETFSLGTSVQLATGVLGVENADITQIGTDKFGISYEDSASNDAYVVICTVSGTTITAGTATLAYGGTIVYTGIIKLDTDKIAVVTNSGVVAATISGTTPTFGSPVANGALISNKSKPVQIGTDKIACAVSNIYIVTFSGTVPTIGTPVAVGYTNEALVSPAADVIVYGDTSRMRAATISGTVPTLGTEISGTAGEVLYAASSSVIFGASTNGSSKYTLSGNTLTEVYYDTSFGAKIGSFNDSWFLPNSSVTEPIAVKQGQVGDVQKLSYYPPRSSYNFIGFAQSTVTAGQTVSVALSGLVTNQTGLTAGLVYAPENGSLVEDGTNGFLKATSATDIII